MPTFRERVRRIGEWVHEHCNWETPEEEDEKQRVQTIVHAIQHGRMGIEHMPKRRKTEPTAEENCASSAASGADPPPSSAGLPPPGEVSGLQPQTHSSALLSNDAHNNIQSVRFNCSAGKQSAAGGQAVPVVYEGATLANVKRLLSASEAGVFEEMSKFSFILIVHRKLSSKLSFQNFSKVSSTATVNQLANKTYEMSAL